MQCICEADALCSLAHFHGRGYIEAFYRASSAASKLHGCPSNGQASLQGLQSQST